MTNRQRALIIAVCSLPVALGLWIILSHSSLGTVSTPRFKKIGLVEISDVILSSDAIEKQLRAFRKDKAIAGVLLRVDSPGGAVAPSQEIYGELMKFREVNKPVVASFGNVAASGGYYVACPARRIFADPGTITGSIGVIFRFPQYFKLMDKLGISMEVLKAGDVKDMGSAQRNMTPHERILFQGILDDIHTQFINDVCRARGLNVDTLRAIADGRIMSGRQALYAGLVDTLGGLEDASDYLKKSLGLAENATVVENKPHVPFLRTLIFGELADRFPFLRYGFYPAGSYFLCDKPF